MGNVIDLAIEKAKRGIEIREESHPHYFDEIEAEVDIKWMYDNLLSTDEKRRLKVKLVVKE